MRHSLCRVMCLGLFLGSSSLNAAAPVAQDSSRPPFLRSPSGYALQSVLVPGLGQITQGDWIQGGLFFAGEAFLAYDALHFWEHQYQRGSADAPGRRYDRDTAYGLAVWYGAGALFCAADAFYAKRSSDEVSPTRAAFRSALFPGWGQLSNGKRIKAGAVFLLQTGLGFAAFTQHERFLFYDSRGETDEADFYKNDRNRLLWWSVGALLYSAADAFVDAHLRRWDVSEDLSLIPLLDPDRRMLGLQIRLPLPNYE
jgi:hypothetical protein